MLERVDTLHSRHLIHRDIKPANFVIGVQDSAANVFCVDFGLSKRYRHPKNLHHIPHRDGRSLTGTPRYASINNHLGIEQSRRDDLESIGYVLIYFLKGTLPWQGLKAKNAQKKYRLILEKKQQVSIAQLCQGCPSQFAEFLAYTRSLKFDAKPDIPYLRKLFRDLYHAQGCGSIVSTVKLLCVNHSLTVDIVLSPLSYSILSLLSFFSVRSSSPSCGTGTTWKATISSPQPARAPARPLLRCSPPPRWARAPT